MTARTCLTVDEIATYVAGGATDTQTEHVEGCEQCRRGVALTIRAGRREQAAPGAHDRSDESTEYTLATLRDEEIRNARTMLRVGCVVGLAAIAPVPLFHGHNQPVRVVFSGVVAITIVVAMVTARRIRDPRRYRASSMLAVAILGVAAGLAGILYYGIFSAAQVFPILTTYISSRREHARNTLVVYATGALGQAVIAAIVISGLVPDPGLFAPVTRKGFLVICHLLIQLAGLAAFVIGRRSRTATQMAIANMQRAMMLAARRETLLLEARAELDRALGAGGMGRYTEQTLGSYELGRVLGRGGMGEVYEAHHITTGEPAAVKVLAPGELGNPHSLERFVREVRAISTLRSPYVVRVLAASDERDAIPYLVMERLVGRTLAQVLRDSPGPDGLLVLLDQVGEALEEAWQHGIVHRDLKPHNLFLVEGPRPTWKVLDFGLAALGDHTGTLTRGHVLGTPAYMAPEQARGARVDHRADIYALSAIAYRWLTGRPVCTSPDVHAGLYQIVHETPVRPSAIASLHRDVDLALAIGLAKDPERRWNRVAELREALARALEGRLDPASRARGLEITSRHPWNGA